MDVALTYIYGIGRTMALKILTDTKVDWQTNSDNLTADEVSAIRQEIESNYKVEGDLRREITTNIKRLMDIGCYRGLRHRRGLPVRGQKSKTNARTRKGPRRSVMGRKKK
ncbi:30S ribosomal protein S13 [Pseudodesulfovibrio portus]|uniref:Small ribosomal subunit protein uS13 n=2 Tax=Pseudodesulfovibrio portus TaxID=231439 RepID=A0ABM8AV56_9BACT|nr:30S ribosomal protein S13 [Pseudodesulfovibrio portus]